jgi:hypothetical protein
MSDVFETPIEAHVAPSDARALKQLLQQLALRNQRVHLLHAENQQLKQQLAQREQPKRVRQWVMSLLGQRDRMLEDIELVRRSMQAKLDAQAEREKALRELLLDAHDQLLERDEQIQEMLPRLVQAPATAPKSPSAAVSIKRPSRKELHYQRVIAALVDAVQKNTPLDSSVLVISKGDDRLLRFEGRVGWHFPRDRNGRYAGYHPANGEAVVAELKKHRRAGAKFIAIPETSSWWLDHYREFARFLRSECETLVKDPMCRVYRFKDAAARTTGRKTKRRRK